MSALRSKFYGSFSRRALARLLDAGLVALCCGSLYIVDLLLGFPLKYSMLFGYKHPLSVDMFMYYDFPRVAVVFIAVKLVIAYPYFALMESSPWQGTLGKSVMGIKVTDLEGRRITFGRATGRYFLKIASATMLMLGYVASFSNRKQTFHDYISKTLVLRRFIIPPLDVLPGYSSRWLFDLPFMGTNVDNHQTNTEYMCVFCRYRSGKKQVGCPSCGLLYAYGEVQAMKAIQLLHGLIFGLIGLAILSFGTSILVSELRQPYPLAPWWIFVMIFAGGGIFALGGLSSLVGRSWLLRLLLLVFGGGGRIGRSS